MKRNRTGLMVVAAWLAVTAGCATSPVATEKAGEMDKLIPCEEPRPEICTMHYEPVCGVLEGGGSKTYANACVACSDPVVTGYIKSPCANGTP